MPPKPDKPSKKPTRSYNDKLSRIKHKAGNLAEKFGMEKGYRSGLEVRTGKIMKDLGIPYQFESLVIPWLPLPIQHKYNPDFSNIITKSGKHLIIETKGRFMPEDMQKHLAVKLQSPQYDIRFVFQNSKLWHRKAVRKNYAKWCEEHGFKYCDFRDFGKVILEWMKE